MVLVRPHVPQIVAALVFFILIPFYSNLINPDKKKVDRSVSVKGLAQAAIAAPFLLLFATAVLFAIGFCFVYIDEHFGNITRTIIFLVLIITFWTLDIVFALRKEKKRALPVAAPDARPMHSRR